MNFHKVLLPKALLITLLVSSACIAFGSSRPNRKAQKIPFEVANNLIILRTRVNASRPLSFILDTGASTSVINESRATELGLKLEGETEATTGGGSVEASFVKGVTLSISGVELPDSTLAAIRLSGLEAGFGRNVDGILGYDLFDRFVVEIDYRSQIVRLHDPKNYRYSGSGDVLPITIEDNIPFIRAKVMQPGTDLVEGRFEFDTGQVGALSLAGGFVAKNRLLKATQRTLQITTGAILAGRSGARVGRVQRLHLGRFVIDDPVANFLQETEGDGASTDNAGLIGGDLLRRFKVVVDYSRKQVILESNKQFSAPYEFDMSGMSLAAQGSELRIYRVRTLIESSPATEAGVRVGDIVTAINGNPAAEMTLAQIRQMFKQEGQEYVLSIKRGEEVMRARIKTRKLI